MRYRCARRWCWHSPRRLRNAWASSGRLTAREQWLFCRRRRRWRVDDIVLHVRVGKAIERGLGRAFGGAKNRVEILRALLWCRARAIECIVHRRSEHAQRSTKCAGTHSRFVAVGNLAQREMKLLQRSIALEPHEQHAEQEQQREYAACNP